jgi:hypothetical protein
VVQVQLAERRVRSRTCRVDAEVAWARAACGGPTQRRTGLGKALEKASSLPALACATMLDHSASPSVARTCLGMRVSSPLQRCYARLRAILDSLTGWSARRRDDQMNRHPWAAVVPGLRAPAVTDRSGIPAGRRLGERPPVSSLSSFIDMSSGERGRPESVSRRLGLEARDRIRNGRMTSKFRRKKCELLCAGARVRKIFQHPIEKA